MKYEKSLAYLRPDLAKEWHPTKNGTLTPQSISAGSGKKVWWFMPYDDPVSGKHFDFEWECTINNRSHGNGCPFLTGRSIWTGYNDLTTTNPELAKEWHPTKNGSLTPSQVTSGSNKKVWWFLPYDDPKTGCHFDFEWQETICNRINGCNCPFLSGHQVWKGYNDFATTNPELTKEWHPTKNGQLLPSDLSFGSNIKVWWLLPYDDPNTGKHFDFEWQASVAHRAGGEGCPFLVHNPKLWKGFNDLATTNPELAIEWHPTKNGSLTPSDVTFGSHKKVWWLFPYDDPVTGKHFDFEWIAPVCDRSQDRNCPFLSSPAKAVWKGFNDLATTNPELIQEWHPTKNGELKPDQVLAGSEQKVWWYLPYDDPKTGKHFVFEWRSMIISRAKGIGCPYLSGKAILCGFNDLSTTNPEVAKEWHPTKNGALTPYDFTSGSNKKVWWFLPYDDPKTGRHFDFEWRDSIAHRTANRGCPFISQSRGEQLIMQYLIKNELKYRFEVSFTDLFGTGDKPLSYDFEVKTSDGKTILIEYQGIQHYEANDFFGGKKQFKIQQEHDKRKRAYAKSHGYSLIEVPYTLDVYEEIADFLDSNLFKYGV